MAKQVICVRLLQFANALSPMLVTLSGIVMFVRLQHLSNASVLMLVTLFEIVYSFSPFESQYTSSPLIMKHLPS